MHKNTLKVSAIALAVASALFSINVFAAASVNDRPDTSQSFLENSEEGWFWYKDEKELESKPEENKDQTSEQKPQTEKPFSVAWLKKNLPRYIEIAIDNPTPENVRAFLLVQRVMLDKAENFAKAVQTQVVGDALVDEAARRGLSTVAAHSLNAKGEDETKRLLDELSNKIGLFFFFSSDCSYCKSQAPILGYFGNKYDMGILGVSVDGGSLSIDGKEPFPWKTDAGLAPKLGITQVPALVIVTPDGDAVPIAQGVLSLPEIEQRILLASKRKGWITQEQYEKTRPLDEAMRNDLSKALDPKTELAEKKLRSYQEADGFIPPDRLVPLVTARAKYTNTSMSTSKSAKAARSIADDLKDIADKAGLKLPEGALTREATDNTAKEE